MSEEQLFGALEANYKKVEADKVSQSIVEEE